jgi:hypothetical protein
MLLLQAGLTIPPGTSTMLEDSRPTPRREVPTCAIQALTSALILSIGSSLGGYLLFTLGLPLTLAGFVLACRAALNWSKPSPAGSFAWVTALLTAMAALAIVGPTTGGLLWYEVLKRLFAVLSIVLVGFFSIDDWTRQRRAALITVAAGSVLLAIGPIGAPHPPIDVFTWTQTSVQALLHRTNPYTVVAPDIYLGRYDPGYTVSVYPYMPATLIAYAPWVGVLGDFRFALAASLVLTIAVMFRIGHRLGVSEQLTYAAALAVVLHPSGQRMVESGWTEPLLVFGATLFVYFALHNPKGIGQAATFLLLPALKQYVVAPTVLYLIRGRRFVRPGAIVAASALGAATVLPFLIWNWQATLTGIVFQMRAPTVPRLGSTSLVALMATMSGIYPGRWISAVVQLIVGGVAWWRLKEQGLSGLMLASALSLYATFLFGWQAFVNYYYFVGALLILAAMVRANTDATA